MSSFELSTWIIDKISSVYSQNHDLRGNRQQNDAVDSIDKKDEKHPSIIRSVPLTQLSANWLKKVVEPPEPNSSTERGENLLQTWSFQKIKPLVVGLMSEHMSWTPPRSMNTCLRHKKVILKKCNIGIFPPNGRSFQKSFLLALVFQE